MQRKVFDKLASGVGALLVVGLLAAGGLLMWGYSFANSSVHDQLAAQQIYFPPSSVWAHATKNNSGEIQARMIPYLKQYSGQQLLTGQQAEAYANHFIAYHLDNMPYHGVYSKVSAANMAATPGSTQQKTLSALATTSFQGTTLRGLLLEAFAFWTIGQVMFWGAVTSFAVALLLTLLVGGGLWHARRTSEEARLFAVKAVPVS